MRAIALAAPLLTACYGTSAEWSPKHAEQPEYPKVVDVASRLRQAPDCSRIGVVHADGDPDEVIPTLAREAADHGGTDYTIEDDQSDTSIVTHGSAQRLGGVTFMHARSRTDTQRRIWAIVYRCKDDVRQADD